MIELSLTHMAAVRGGVGEHIPACNDLAAAKRLDDKARRLKNGTIQVHSDDGHWIPFSTAVDCL